MLVIDTGERSSSFLSSPQLEVSECYLLVLAKVLGVLRFDTPGNYEEIFPVLRFCLGYPNPSDYRKES